MSPTDCIQIQNEFQLGIKYYQQGKLQAASVCFQQVLQQEPNHDRAHYNLGIIYQNQGNSIAALQHYRKAIEVKPDYISAYNNLGNLYLEQGQFQVSIDCFKQAIALQPDYAPAYNNLGNVYREQGQFQASIDCFQKAIQLQPDYAAAYNNLGNVCKEQGQFQTSIDCFDRAIALQPDCADAHYNRGHALLLLGEFDRGFLEYEWRFETKTIGRFKPKTPMWDGSSLEGKSIVLWNEQGLGDAIQFVRYAQKLQQQGGQVILCTHPTLVSLFRNCLAGEFEVIAKNNCDIYAYDCHASMMSLPGIFNTSLDSIPNSIPYILPPRRSRDDSLRDSFAARGGIAPTNTLCVSSDRPLLSSSDYRIGIVWAGQIKNPDYRKKSCSPELFIDLLDLGNVTLYSLQVGVDAVKIQPWVEDRRVWDLSPLIGDFVDTVCSIEQLDLVITIDTAVAHLAGAMGKPVWVLLPFVPDWRWQLYRQDSPWYPTMRLFSQPSLGDWGSVFERVKEKLAEVLKGQSSIFNVEKIKTVSGKIPTEGKALNQINTNKIATSKPDRIKSQKKSNSKRLADCQETHPTRDIQASVQALEQQLDLGIAHHQAGAFTQAQTCYEQVLQWQPDRADAWHLLGVIAYQQEEYLTAIAQIDRAIELNANAANFYNSLGSVYQKLRQFDRSLECYQKVIQLEANFFKTHNNIGLIYQEKGQFQEAIASYQQAIQLQPNYAEAYLNLSIACDKQMQLTRAIECCQKAIQLKPEYPDAYCQLGRIFSKQVKPKETVRAYQRALQIDPNYAVARHHLMFSLLYYSCDYEPSEIYAEHRKWAECHAKLLAENIAPYDNNLALERRLRIGYVSGDFKTHSVTYFFEPLLAIHNSRDFEIICYANNTTIDAATQRLRQLADGWREIFTLNDAQVAELIRKDKIDILVDLSGHTMDNRLLVFARKPAPIQVTYLGYPGTTGLDTIDYRLTDAWADPQGATEHLHAEQLVRLPHGFLCYLPATNCPDVSPPPVLQSNQITFGCFNNLTKVNPELIGCWAKILQSVPNSRLIIKSKPLVDTDNCAYLHGLFQQYGIERDRIQLIGWLANKNQHLDLYNQVDIALDTFPYHGTTTTCEAMWMGVPVITQAGKTHVSRVGVSLLSSVGLESLIAESAADYIQKAVNLANDREQLQEIRSHLRHRMQASPLTNASLISRSLEDAYRAMWRRFCDPSSWEKLEVFQPINSTQIQQQFELGFKHHQSGQIQAAAACYHQVLEWQPNHADVWHLLGVIAAQQKQYQIAIERISRAIALNSKSPSFYHNLGNVYQEQGQLSQAIASYQKVIQLQPEYTDAYKNLGIACKKQGQWTEAMLNSGIAHQLTGEFQLAIASYQKAIQFKPDCAVAHYNLGRVYKEQGQWTKAIECFDRAIQLKFNYVDAHLSRGFALLLLGDFQQGLLEYEWRFKTQQFNDFKQLKVPMWDGTPLEGKSIVLGNEQGLGDAIQFVRYAPMLREQGARVILSTHPALVSLFRECLKGQFEVVESSRCNVYDYDRHVSLMSLPHIFKTSLETIPNCTPYIVIPDSLRDRCILPSSHFYRIGIVWATGKLNTQLYQQKSCKPELFMNLLDLENISLYSLQVGEDASQIQPWLNHQRVCDCSPLLKDFIDTACTIDRLDLVITVDTAVAHLAGAMGKPVWVLLPFVPDWRWLLERQDSPWYPTMRLFRQPSPGDWGSVFSQVKAKLTGVI